MRTIYLGKVPSFLVGLGVFALAATACAQATPSAPGPAAAEQPASFRITLDQAIQLAMEHSPALAAAKSQIPQSQAQEVTAAIKPNPVLSWDALFLPVFNPGAFSGSYLNNTAEFDASVGYTLERGGKRQARIGAAVDATTVVKAQVVVNGRTLTFNVAQQFVNVLLGKSSLDFSKQDLASWNNTANISESQFTAGALSKGDLDSVRLQTLTFETTVSGAQLSLEQALTALRQQIGFSGVPMNYDVIGDLEFKPVHGTLDDLNALALQSRPDLIAARDGVTAAKSQIKLAQADAKRDLTVTGQYSHVAATNDLGSLFSIEIPIHDRNQGEIARTQAALTQAEDQAQQANEQVLTDVATAYEAVIEGAKIINLYDSGYRAQAKEALDIRQYSHDRGASSLLDLLDAERTYRTTELGYRQALATYMLAVEQLKEAVGTRTLP